MKMRSIVGKTGIWYKQRKGRDGDKKGECNNKRFLITINVFGSAGPIRFVVNQDDTAGRVIETALKIYAREGRLPILGSDVNNFFLYPANAGFDVVQPWEAIGSRKEYKNFVLFQKQSKAQMTQGMSQLQVTNVGKGSRWGLCFRLKVMPPLNGCFIFSSCINVL